MKFKNNKELIAFIVMNILGSPIIPILAGLKWGWIGLVVSIILFLISFRVWKYFGKNNAKLSINPSFSFGSKTWWMF